MGSYASIPRNTHNESPGSQFGDEQADSYRIPVGDFGLVSLREIHSALASRQHCICHRSIEAIEAECPFTPLDFQHAPELIYNNTDSTDQFGFGSYSPLSERQWCTTETESSMVPAWPDTDASQLFAGPTNLFGEVFDNPTTTQGDCFFESPAPSLSIDAFLPTMGGSEYNPPTPVDCSTYSPSSGSHSASGDSVRDEGEPRFVCSECQGNFPTYYTLEEHARSTAHRAYVCPEPSCNSRYYRRDVFVRHTKTHRESGLHICKICELSNHRKTFKRKDHLRQHIQQIHPGHSVQDASGKTPSTHSDSSSPMCRAASATVVGNRLKAALAKDRGVKPEKL